MLIKMQDLLFKNRKKEIIKLAGKAVNTQGPRGIRSLCRPETTGDSPAKYSNLGLVLDAIILDHTVIGMQTTSSVYAKFTHKGNVYQGVFDGEQLTWVGPDPGDYASLIPVLLYTLSDLYENENADELKGHFKDIKDTKDPNAVLLLCDAFYYAYAKQEENKVLTMYSNGMLAESIKRGIDNGIYNKIPLMEGLSEDIPAATSISKVETIEPEEDYEVIFDEWTDEQKAHIPSKKVLDTFIMTPEAASIAKKVKFRMDKVIKRMQAGKEGLDAIGGDYVNLLMVGRPSTGKTTIANAVAAMTGMPIYTIPFSKHTEEDVVEGKNKVVEGKIGFVETEFLKAYEHGGIIVCEEINLADPGVVMGSMGQAIEKPFIVMKDGYIPVRRHPLCIVIGTMNTGTAGSKQLNQALSSRFKCTYTLEDPDKNTFINILASQGYSKRNCRYIYDAYNKIISYLKSPEQSQEELCENITLRGCFGALECVEEGQSFKEAINNTLVGKIAEVDLEVANKVKTTVIDSLKDK